MLERQELDAEAVQELGHGRQDLLLPLVPADAAAAVHGPCRIAGQGADEIEDVLAAADESDEPLPGEAAQLRQHLLLAVGALDVAEADAAVLLNAGQDLGQEDGVQLMERTGSGDRERAYGHGGRPP